jgi:AICAR transformylase/IMP cyclohydrolase PurH
VSVGFGLISRVMSVEEAYTDADSTQVTVSDSYMPKVELLKAARTGLSLVTSPHARAEACC